MRELGIDERRLFGLFQFEQLVVALISHQLHHVVLEESAPSAQTRLQLLSEGVDLVLKHQLNFIRVRINVCFIHTRAKYNNQITQKRIHLTLTPLKRPLFSLITPFTIERISPFPPSPSIPSHRHL